MKIEFSLAEAIPTLIVERVGNDWHASIEFDWSDSMNGTVFPSEPVTDAEGKLPNGKYPDWVKALGEVGQIGAVAATMKFPEKVYVGKLPEKFVGMHRGNEKSMLAYDTEEGAKIWSRSYDGSGPDEAVHVVPSEITEEQVVASIKRSIEAD